MRGVIEALSELRELQFGHGNLTIENVVITKEGALLRSKLTGMKNCKSLDSSNNDYRCFGNIVKFCLEDDEGNISSEGGWDLLNKLEGYFSTKVDRCSYSFIRKAFRLNPRVLLKHPVLWSPYQSRLFIETLASIIKRADRVTSFATQQFIRDLDQFKFVTVDKCWDTKIPKETIETKKFDEEVYYNYDFSSTRDLLMFMRHKIAHYHDNELNKVKFGERIEDFINYVTGIYPSLLWHAFRTFELHFDALTLAWIRKENTPVITKKYYESYLLSCSKSPY